LDVLDGLKEIGLCTGYKINIELVDVLPYGADKVVQAEPIIEMMPGWSETTAGVKQYEELPENARHLLERIAESCEVPIHMISTGPDRTETIMCENPFEIIK